MDDLVSLNQIKANLPDYNTLIDYFLDYNNNGVNVVLVGRWTGLRTVLYYYYYVKNNLYRLNKIEKVVPEGKAPNVKLITINCL